MGRGIQNRCHYRHIAERLTIFHRQIHQFLIALNESQHPGDWRGTVGESDIAADNFAHLRIKALRGFPSPGMDIIGQNRMLQMAIRILPEDFFVDLSLGSIT